MGEATVKKVTIHSLNNTFTYCLLKTPDLIMFVQESAAQKEIEQR